MKSNNIQLSLPCSLNRRNIMAISREITDIESDILIIKDNRTAPMKSTLGLLSLCCNQGDNVEIICCSRNEDVDTKADLQRVVEILNRI